MKFLYPLFVIQSLIVLLNSAFIDHYINPKVRPFCNEIQEKIEFQYSFRARPEYNINSHVVYLFTKEKVFSITPLTASLRYTESTKFVIPELFFYKTDVTELSEFWGQNYKNETYNTVFADVTTDSYNQSFWVFGQKYRKIHLNIKEFKITKVEEPIDFADSPFGFMQNTKIKAKGFENIFGVDIASSWGLFNPVRVYVRDLQNDGKAISFAFYNKSFSEEEFENGKHYKYRFDSAAYLNNARSLADPSIKDYNHYFELRTRKGRFSLFDFTNNRDFLLVGTNEELLGCPPSFCHSRQFDDIIRLHDGTKLLVFREWMWSFNKPGDRIVWEEAVIANISSRIHNTTNFKKAFDFGIRDIIDGSFTDLDILYIFRNGSFISSENDTIISEFTPFDDFEPISQFFKGVPDKTFEALFYHKESRVVYFIFEDKYWPFSMENKALVSEDFPKHIEFLGLPYDFKVKATYVDEDQTGKQTQFYFFTDNRYIILNSTEFKSGKFKAQKPIYLCTSVNFFSCPDTGSFVCPELPTTERPKEDNSWTYLIVLLAIICILIALIFLMILFMFWSKSKPNDEKNIGKNKANEQNIVPVKDKTTSVLNEKQKEKSMLSTYSTTSRSDTALK